MNKMLLSICSMLAFASYAFAEDKFSVDNILLPQNSEADVVVRFSLDEGNTCAGYTFWLKVPEELEFVTYEKNSQTYITYIAGDSYDETPIITGNIVDGNLKVGCLMANSDPLNKQSGVLVTFRVRAKSEVGIGDTFFGTLSNGVVSADNGFVHDVASSTFTINIGFPVATRTVLDETSTQMPEAANSVDVTVRRTIKAGEWSTIVLPFAMTADQVKAAFGEDVQLANFIGYETEEEGNDVVGIMVKFQTASVIEANHPYIIKVSNAVTEFMVDGVNVEPVEEPIVATVTRTRRQWSEMIGTYVANTALPEQTLFLNGNQFLYSSETTTMKGYRAYFDFYDVLAELDKSYFEVRMIIDNDSATSLDGMFTELSSDGQCYDLAGRCLNKPNANGVYIVGGRKVAITTQKKIR